MIKTYYLDKEYICEHYNSAAFELYFGGLSIGALDIETTGLSPVSGKFILGGLLTLTEKGARIRQFFAENADEELEALNAFLAEVCKLDAVITFNGKHFDIPFVEKRCASLGLIFSPLPFNLDLYLVLNGHSDLRSFLPNLKQKTIESFMGLWSQREDEISGAESVEFYHNFLRTGDPALRDKILLHNSDDVQQLYRLLPVLGKTDFHKAMYTLGFPLQNYRITACEIKSNFLRITGKQGKKAFDYISFSSPETPYSILFDRFSGDFEFIIPLIRRNGFAFLDLEPLPGDFSELGEYPACLQGYLVVQSKNEADYLAINHFTKILIGNFLEVSK